MTMALGVKAPLDLSVFSAAGGALLLATSANFPFSLDELVRTNKQAESSARGGSGANDHAHGADATRAGNIHGACDVES